MLYRNVKTGTVVKSRCKITGNNWAPVEDPQQPPAEKPSADDHAEDSAAQETTVADTPAEKPQTTRRAKK